MNSRRNKLLEQAVRTSWSRRNHPRTLTLETRETIMKKIMERAIYDNRPKPFLEVSVAASGLAWAASVLAIVSATVGMNALYGLKLTANYMAYFVFV